MTPETIEQAKQVADAIIISAGATTTVVYWFTALINPIISAGVGVMTMIWLYHRTKKIRKEK